jgi:phytanoyl-CoA hydroxylase
MTSSLDVAALRTFAETGVFVREAAVAPAACEALLAALSALIERVAAEHLAGKRTELSFWKLLPASAHAADVFFELSADASRAASPGVSLDAAQPPLTALPAPVWESRAMRIGHGLHLVEPAFAAFCRSPAIAAPLRCFAHVAAQLSAGASPHQAARAALESTARARFVQSAVIYKQPRSDAVQFGFHRDSAYLPSEPESLVLAFVALDDTTLENGCLEVIPGTHTEPLGLRYRLDPEGFTALGREPRPAEDRRVSLPVPRGSIVFAHGRTLHASAPNRSAGPRRALIVHAMSEGSHLAPDAWVRAPPGGFAEL